MRINSEGGAHIAAAPHDLVERFALAGSRAAANGRGDFFQAEREAEAVGPDEVGSMIDYMGTMGEHVHGPRAVESLARLGADATAMAVHEDRITGALAKIAGLEGSTMVEVLTGAATAVVKKQAADRQRQAVEAA